MKVSVPRCLGVTFSCALGLAILTGCQNSASRPTESVRIVTYNKDIAPVLFTHCASCHRPVDAAPQPAAAARPDAAVLCVGGAPFPLLDYETTFTYARQIAAATRRRSMPPWLPQPGHGEFVNERRLRDDQIDLFQRWVAQGAPEGDAADRPAPPSFPDGWQLGTPDVVLAVDGYTLQPGDRDVFRNFVVPVPRASTRYVRAIEFRADNPKVLHHANVGVDAARVSRRLDRLDPEPGFAAMPGDEVQNVFGWSPGKVPILEPADTAWVLEDGSDLIVQLHLVSTTTPETVQPKIGLFLTATPPSRAPITIKLESKAIDIPAGEPNYIVEDSYVLPADVDAVSVYPHAHSLAKEMRGTATLPDGTLRPLLWIKQWDVRWQDQYRYRTPVFLPRGTTLSMRFAYDNSKSGRRVTWGPQSTDEMGALWLEVIPRRQQDASLLEQDYFRRALRADIAAAELQVQSKPRDPAVHNLLAMRYIQAARLTDAMRHLDEALRLKRDDAEARSNLGTVLQMQGHIPEATAHMREAVRLKPGDDRLRFNLANVLHAAGRPDEAAREYRRAIQINPDNADAHFNLAMLVGPQGRLDEAIAHLERVIEINPQNKDAHRNLALAQQLKRRN